MNETVRSKFSSDLFRERNIERHTVITGARERERECVCVCVRERGW